MPQRTNEFQKLVALINIALAPNGAKVTESAMVHAPGFGELREIDVLIESEVGPYRIKVAVEAKDHKRKLNIQDIEAIIGKYCSSGSLAVEKVVVVSRRGFSKQAAKKASLIGIELLTLNEIRESDCEKLAPFKDGVKINFRMGPLVANVEIEPLPQGISVQEAYKNGKIVCHCHGIDCGTPIQYANQYLKDHMLTDATFKTI